MRVIRFVFAIVVLAGASDSASAWWEDGHIIVARIAEKNLTDAARAGIVALLSENQAGERRISDTKICNWADLIRSSGALNRKYPKNDTWHYINIELKDERGSLKFPDDDHVVGAIERFKKVLRDPKADKQDRKEALYFIVHFVGDMHQPMHTGNRDDDKGGNMQPIKSVEVNGKPAVDTFGKPHNLHKVWDGHLLNAEKGTLTNDDFATRLNDEITAADREAWREGATEDWAWDSHYLCVDRVYKFSDGTALPAPDALPVDLTADNYMKANRPFVRQQLKKGGIRLAKVLNEAFEPAASPK
jgi:hypothetical protein